MFLCEASGVEWPIIKVEDSLISPRCTGYGGHWKILVLRHRPDSGHVFDLERPIVVDLTQKVLKEAKT